MPTTRTPLFQRRFTASPLVMALVAVAAVNGLAEVGQPVTIRSQSGQFVVHGLPMGPPPPSRADSGLQYLRLDPSLTAVSFERIRQAIQAELDWPNWPNQWLGLITVVTVPVRGENTRVTIKSERYSNGWGYRVVFPEIVDKDRFITAAVETMLREFANRRAVTREAELPRWLVEGLTAELMATSLPVLALEPSSEVNRRERNPDPLAGVRERLRQRDPLSFDELSMPTGESLDVDHADHYRACAHLFVHELLRLRDGRACLRRMLERLPENLNWQTTFLQAYERHFSRLLDVDQWYTLHAAGARGRDMASIFPAATTLLQLDGILATAVEVRVAAQELPLRVEMKLQRLVVEWDFPRQHPVLVGMIRRLQSLQGRAAPEQAGLVGEYVDALVDYVGNRNLVLPAAGKQRERLRPRGDAREFVKLLDGLDARRAAQAQRAQRAR